VPSPDDPAGVVSGAHGDGTVDVTFAASIAATGTYDPVSASCTATCHDRGGTHPRPAWTDTTPPACTTCHGSPPDGHAPGPCSLCHVEANAKGTAVSGGPLHLNGVVDLGDGSGTCGACHGHGDDPRPDSGAHAAHANPSIAEPISCVTCHPATTSARREGKHMDGVVEVTFSGIADARGARPEWDGRACTSVACHGASLTDAPAVTPVWRDTSGAASRCGACHGVPPTQHTPSRECSRVECHGAEVGEDASGAPAITQAGRMLHVDGAIDRP
jgi:predicted CxxxxCH...CXXCH cytochrome family protein